jgi:hypothetical protein
MEVPSVTLIDLSVYWAKADTISPDWNPRLYHCGAYDPTRDCFPVLSGHNHIIYIPTSSKPIFRFAQHAMYGLWYMSLCQRFNSNTRANFFRASAYLHYIREAFFEEVRNKFYPTPHDSEHQVLPTCNKMTRQWFSNVLFSWAQVTYHTSRISPPGPGWLPPNDWQVSTKFGKYPICAGFLCYGLDYRLGHLVFKHRKRSYHQISLRFFS